MIAELCTLPALRRLDTNREEPTCNSGSQQTAVNCSLLVSNLQTAQPDRLDQGGNEQSVL